MRACCCCCCGNDGYEICPCHANLNVCVDPSLTSFSQQVLCSSNPPVKRRWQCSLALIDGWWPTCVLLHSVCESNLVSCSGWQRTKPKLNSHPSLHSEKIKNAHRDLIWSHTFYHYNGICKMLKSPAFICHKDGRPYLIQNIHSASLHSCGQKSWVLFS